jgi:CRISPR/Cas system CMR-associated protein Cmr1 (group 7 of RAMP superfamily)
VVKERVDKAYWSKVRWGWIGLEEERGSGDIYIVSRSLWNDKIIIMKRRL